MKNALGIIFAFEDENELRELTIHRTVASVPFGGRYRVIDFSLSGMVNSGISEVGIVIRDRYQSLLDHIGSGRDWDMARKRGGIYMLPPYSYAKQDSVNVNSFYRGKMEALAGVYNFIHRRKQEYVVLSDSNIVANVDFQAVIDQHEKSGAEITAVTMPPRQPAKPTLFMQISPRGRVIDSMITRQLPDEEFEAQAAGIYVMEKKLMEEIILECAAKNLYNLGRDMIQRLYETLRIFVYPFEGYIFKINSAQDFFESNMDLLKKPVRDSLFNSGKPIYTRIWDDTSSRYEDTATVKNSLVANGCYIAGTVENSILFPEVRVGKGTTVKNCIVMQNNLLAADAYLNYIVADKGGIITEGRRLAGHEMYPVFLSKGSVI